MNDSDEFVVMQHECPWGHVFWEDSGLFLRREGWPERNPSWRFPSDVRYCTEMHLTFEWLRYEMMDLRYVVYNWPTLASWMDALIPESRK